MQVSVPKINTARTRVQRHHGALAKIFVFLMFCVPARLQTVRNVQQNLEAPLSGSLMSFCPTAFA